MKKDDATHQEMLIGQDLSAALFAFRDALMELSLAMKDWQFEHDLQQRQATEDATRQLFEKIGRP